MTYLSEITQTQFELEETICNIANNEFLLLSEVLAIECKIESKIDLTPLEWYFWEYFLEEYAN